MLILLKVKPNGCDMFTGRAALFGKQKRQGVLVSIHVIETLKKTYNNWVWQRTISHVLPAAVCMSVGREEQQTITDSALRTAEADGVLNTQNCSRW